MKLLLMPVAAATILLSSCHFFMGERVSGNGHITSEVKTPGSFSGVDVSGNIKVRVRQDATAAVKIETDENIMPYLEVYTNGNTLIIRPKRGFNLDPSHDIVAYVSAPAFKNIDLSGNCDVTSDGTISGNDPLNVEVSGSGDINMDVQVPKMSTSISGSGSVVLRGQVADFSAEISGSGDVKCFDLSTDNTKLELSGSADADVNVNKQLNVDISGGASVRYKGNPSVSQDISGSGSIKKVG